MVRVTWDFACLPDCFYAPTLKVTKKVLSEKFPISFALATRLTVFDKLACVDDTVLEIHGYCVGSLHWIQTVTEHLPYHKETMGIDVDYLHSPTSVNLPPFSLPFPD